MEWTPLARVTVSLQADMTLDALSELTADLVILPVVDEKMELSGLTAAMDTTSTGGALAQVWAESTKALAKRGGTSAVTRVVGDKQTRARFALMAVGSLTLESLTGAGFVLGKAIAKLVATEKKITSAMVVLPETLAADSTIMTDLVTVLYQSLYVDDRFRSKKKPVAEDLKTITLASEGAVCDATVVVPTAQYVAAGVIMAKDIVNAPHNVLNSVSLAETAQRIAAASRDGTVTCTILNVEECEKRGMGAYLGVARGSETPPQFIHLTYKPTGTIHRKVALVGKGVLFDTGGYNIKTQLMELMKFDCGGAAAVLGAARSVSQLCPPGVEVHFIVAVRNRNTTNCSDSLGLPDGNDWFKSFNVSPRALLMLLVGLREHGQ